MLNRLHLSIYLVVLGSQHVSSVERREQFSGPEPLTGIEAKGQFFDTASRALTKWAEANIRSFPFVQTRILDNLLSFYLDQRPESDLVVFCPLVAIHARVPWETYSVETSDENTILPFIHDFDGAPSDPTRAIYCPFWQYASRDSVDQQFWVNGDLLAFQFVSSAVAQINSNDRTTIVPTLNQVPLAADSLLAHVVLDEPSDRVLGYFFSFERSIDDNSETGFSEDAYVRQVMAQSLETEAQEAQLTWPFVFSSTFASTALGFRRMFEEVSIFTCTLVQDAATLEAWHAYVVVTSSPLELSSDVVFSEFTVNGGVTPETGPFPYCPHWQSSPLDNSFVNFNLFSDMDLASAYDTLLAEGTATATLPLVTLAYGSSFWSQPIIDSNNNIVAILFVEQSSRAARATEEPSTLQPTSQAPSTPAPISSPTTQPTTGPSNIANTEPPTDSASFRNIYSVTAAVAIGCMAWLFIL